MKGGELMRSERTAAEFDILVAFLGCARTISRSSDMGTSRGRGPIATGYRVDHRAAFPPGRDWALLKPLAMLGRQATQEKRWETSHERMAETRDHRVRGWNGSDELSAGRARPRLIRGRSLTSFCPATASAKREVVVFAWTLLRKGNAASGLVSREA
jgi:hypothetical protein